MITPEPSVWWRCPLDVETLAATSVEQACTAAAEFASARGISARYSTRPELVAASFAAIAHLRIDDRPAGEWGPLSGFFPVADGWVRLHGNYPHHAAVLKKVFGVETRDQLAAQLVGEARYEVEQAVRGAGGIAAAVRTEREWAAHPQGKATTGDPWAARDVRHERPVPARGSGSGDGLPLTGVRVLDLTRVIAGPTCSQLLACLGADVLRVDPPARPELIDQYLSNGMGKRSAEADLRTAADAVHDLLASADVVLHGYRPGALERFGLEPDELAQRHPALVIADLSAWGSHGPWAGAPGFDSIVQAASGIAVVCGGGDRPGALPVQALDHASGYMMAAEVITMLARGQAGVIGVSLTGAARTLLALPRREPVDPDPLAVPTTTVRSPHGRLRAVPPPVLVDGRTIERDVSGYGRASLEWLTR